MIARTIRISVLAATFLLLFGGVALAETGQLTFDVKSFRLEKKVKKKVESALKYDAVFWGMVDQTLLITQVNTKVLKPDIPNQTRYAEATTIELEAGDYAITCIAYKPPSKAKTIDVALDEGAFLNEAVLNPSGSAWS